jgi:uncharacterized protein (DUF488 family)
MTDVVFTIGHSTHSYEGLLHLLRGAGVTAIADVRSSPYSRHQPQFNQDDLRQNLRLDGIQYAFLGNELGGRPKDKRMFCDGVADYERMARAPEFQKGIERICNGSSAFRVALMCSEHDPLDCHRCLLVGRALKDRDVQVSHILSDGTLKSQNEVELELVRALKQNRSDLFPDDQIAAAYRDRASRVAFSEAGPQLTKSAPVE